MALTVINHNEVFKYKSINIRNLNTDTAIRLLNWCRDKELYLYWSYYSYDNIDFIISHISKNSYTGYYITICYLDESHPDVVELKLTWL